MKPNLILLIFLLFCSSSYGQIGTEDVNRRVYEQLLGFPQEKVYLHIDKDAYVSGETIWFRAYLTDALQHIEDQALSRYLYVDLVNPEGDILYNYQIRPDEQGLYHNNIVLAEDLPEGYYLLRSYTRYMSLSRPDYIYERPLFIADPMRGRISVDASFRQRGDRSYSVKFTFRDGTDGEFINMDRLKFRAGTRNLTDFSAKNEISFRLPDESRHIYIEFEHNSRLYRKYFPVIVSVASELDLSFYPEGGYVVSGSTNLVGFKAMNSSGSSESVTGELYEDGGQKVADFATVHAGMGSFSFYANPGKRYYALCRNDGGEDLRFDFPESTPLAHSLQTRIVGRSVMIACIRGTQAQSTALSVLVHMKGRVVHHATISAERGIRLDLSMFPSGLLQVLLLDSNMNTLSERMLFYDNGLITRPDVIPDKDIYARRELVKVKVKADDLDQTGIDGWFSVSVTDDRDILPDTTRSIVSYLLLSSELRGNIEDPEYYFSGNDGASEALDALMLTQGWRRYDIPKVLLGEIESPPEYIELRQNITGQVTTFSGKPVENGGVLLFSAENEYISETFTGSDGRFSFIGFEFPDSSKYMLRALSAGGRNAVSISIDERDMFSAKPTIFKERSLDKQFLDYVVKSDMLYSQEHGVRVIDIDPIYVRASRRYLKESIYSYDSNLSVNVKDVEHMYPNMALLLEMLPGVRYATEKDSVMIRYGPDEYPAAVFIDNMLLPVDSYDLLLSLDVNIVERIERVIGAEATMLGFPGAWGGVLIFTKQRAPAPYEKPIYNIVNAEMAGYRKPTEFYSPKYETRAQRESMILDLRTTLYWKPNLWLNNGEAEFEFYTADNPGSYSVVIEGLTTEGEIIRQIKQINK